MNNWNSSDMGHKVIVFSGGSGDEPAVGIAIPAEDCPSELTLQILTVEEALNLTAALSIAIRAALDQDSKAGEEQPLPYKELN